MFRSLFCRLSNVKHHKLNFFPSHSLRSDVSALLLDSFNGNSEIAFETTTNDKIKEEKIKYYLM